MQRIYQIKQTVRFRSWIRKGYAMFFSLGRCVTIGFLAKAVTEVALKKQKSGIMQPLYIPNGGKEAMNREDDPDVLPDFSTLLSLMLQPQMVAEVSCGAIKRSDKFKHIYVPERHTDGADNSARPYAALVLWNKQVKISC